MIQADPVYDVVAAFVARLASLGVTDAVISPGSRSTPLALCFHAQPRIRTWIQLDERAAGFFALGLGRATGRPAALVCTSGTAAANYLPAVVEASHAGVAVVVCTADRPPELRGWGSPQTIDQVGLYGTAARWSVDLPVPGDASPAAAIAWAETAVERASDSDPGPVHLNWPLREPLEPLSVGAAAPAGTAAGSGVGAGTRDVAGAEVAAGVGDVAGADTGDVAGAEVVAGVGDVAGADTGDVAGAEVVAGVGDVAGSGVAAEAGVAPRAGNLDRNGVRLPAPELAELAGIVTAHERGVVVVGPWPGGGLDRELEWASEARRFAAWAGWPVIGEPITHVRSRSSRPSRPSSPDAKNREGPPGCVVATADHLLADGDLAEALRPDAAVLVGRTVTTKPVRLWLERTRPRHVVLVDPEDRWERAVFRLTGHVPAPVESLGSITAGTALSGRDAAGGWLDTWSKLDTATRTAAETAVEASAETAVDAPADGAVEAAADGGPLLSARASRVLVDALPDGAVMMATNSMPVRDLDAFVFDTGSVVCCANRGAAGIDGSASTALGIAAADPSRTVALYTGDLALLHDLGGLTAAARLGLHLIAVCVDNDGGEIFSLLPVADRVPAGDFERLFRTPHGLDLCRLDGFGGIRARRMATAGELSEAVQAAAATRTPGVDLCIIDVSRDDDVAQRRAVTAAAQRAARQALAAGWGHV